jgi:small subunit ribosomal protein S17
MAKQNFVGMVISHGKMNKTVKVRVQRMHFNKIINKDIVRFTDFLVHDEANKCKEGDIVRIQYVRPLSARKSFAVSEILRNKGLSWIKYREEAPAKVKAEELQKIAEYKEQIAKKLGENGHETVKQQMDDFRTLNKISLTNLTDESKEQVSSILKKYNIDSLEWPNKYPLFDLEINKLRNELEDLKIVINKSNFGPQAAKLLKEDPKKANQILLSLGKSEPEKMPKNIKKNILMKYYVNLLSKDSASA